jgi:hypothetical protein
MAAKNPIVAKVKDTASSKGKSGQRHGAPIGKSLPLSPAHFGRVHKAQKVREPHRREHSRTFADLSGDEAEME